MSTGQDIQGQISARVPRMKFEAAGAAFQLARIEPGEFMMGSPAAEVGVKPFEMPARVVRISKPFYIGIFEITQAQYRAVTGTMPAYEAHDDWAVDSVAFSDASMFCQKLSAAAGAAIMLPTEAQWEYACRAGTRTRFNLGDDEASLARGGWYVENSGSHAQPVGQKQPNAWGLYDMLGNVAEYCSDFIPDLSRSGDIDPVGVRDRSRTAIRGGSYTFPAVECRCASRMPSHDTFGGAGVRILINAE